MWFVLLLVLCANANAQRLKKILDNEYSETVFDKKYLDYSKWKFHFNNVMYAPAYAKKIEGVYDIDTEPMGGMNFGVQYTFRREMRLSYYTGLDMDYLPFYYYYYEVPSQEFPVGTPELGYDYDKRINEHNVLTMPFGVSWKWPAAKKYYSRFNFIFNTDIRFHFIQTGEMSLTKRRGEIWYFHLNGKTKNINILSPTLNFAAGIDWMTRFAIINLNFNVQKGIVPYLRGEYFFHNLRVSPDTRGIYKVRADYVGIDIGITPKKFRKKK